MHCTSVVMPFYIILFVCLSGNMYKFFKKFRLAILIPIEYSKNFGNLVFIPNLFQQRPNLRFKAPQ